MSTVAAPPVPDVWVLSLHQPWASLYMYGRKPVENRGWPPPRTVGPAPFLLGIHATKRYDHAALEQRLVVEEILHLPHPPADLAGMLLGFVTITTGTHHASECACVCDGHRWMDSRLGPLPCELCNADGSVPVPLRPHNACSPWAQTGDVWHWVRSNPRPLDTPIPVQGRQRLWRLPDAAKSQLPADYLAAA